MIKFKLNCIFYLVCILYFINHKIFSQHTVVDRVIAVVGKECILLSDLEAQVDFYVFNNRVDPNMPNLRELVLEAMINEKLIFAKALEDTTITVSDDEVTNQLDALIAQRIQEFGSEKRLEEIYRMPISKLKREFRDEMRKNLLSSKLKQVKFSDIQCSRREVEEFLIQYKDSLPKVPEELELYHILRVPKISEGVKSKLKARAQIILDSIKAGGDFSDFARRYSEDMGSATVGGDLGFARRGQFVKEFEEAVFALEENEFSEIIETVFGFHIIQLLERRGESVHARHILFKFERDSSAIEDVKTFLKSLKDSVTIGIPFAELAKRYSEDKESGPLGGYLGRIPLNQLEPNLIAVVNNMNEGEISDPIEVSFGSSTAYQIVYIKKRIPEHEFNLVDDWKQLEQLATNNKRNIEYQKWLKKLREEIYWEVRL